MLYKVTHTAANRETIKHITVQNINKCTLPDMSVVTSTHRSVFNQLTIPSKC